jgi:hypothetical protein
VVEITPNGNFFEYLAQELRRLRGVATRYANDALDESEQESVQTLLGALQRFSGKDTGSKELLCFGYHVLARKTGPADGEKAPKPVAVGKDAKPQAAGLPQQSWLSSLNQALRATARRQPPPSQEPERKSA